MAKRKGSAEYRLKPGDLRNLDFAAWGDVGGDEFREYRLLFLQWNAFPGLLELISQKPFPEQVPKYEKAVESLRKEAADFVQHCILERRPDHLRKLAQVTPPCVINSTFCASLRGIA